jgi:KaiC/GvpD/RAD55 family RecA-like ATPase
MLEADDPWLEHQAEQEKALWDAPWTSWDSVNTGDALAGVLDDPPPAYLSRTDGVLLLYNGKVSDIHGEPEACKGWFACYAAADVLHRGLGVVYVDFEDSVRGILGRMRSLGVSDEVLVDGFSYVGPTEALQSAMVQGDRDTRLSFERTLKKSHRLVGLVVLDGVTQAIANQMFGSSNSNDDIAAFYRDMPRMIAHREQCAVLLVDHVTKDSGNPRFAIGGMMKLAAVDGASFQAEVKAPFGRGRKGLVVIKVAKDRPGYVREHGGDTDGFLQQIADMHLESDPATGAVTVRLEPPMDDVGLLRIRMGVVCGALQNNALLSVPDKGLSLTKLRRVLRGCSTEAKDTVIQELVQRKYVRVETNGVGKAKLHFLVDPQFDIPQAQARLRRLRIESPVHKVAQRRFLPYKP